MKSMRFMLFYFCCIIIQLVPSLTSVAHAPSVAGSMAFVAATPSIGTTLADALVTVYGCMVFTIISRPVHDAAAGRVNAIVAVPSQTIQLTVSATV